MRSVARAYGTAPQAKNNKKQDAEENGAAMVWPKFSPHVTLTSRWCLHGNRWNRNEIKRNGRAQHQEMIETTFSKQRIDDARGAVHTECTRP
jgi:predicted HD phosphohydrolase